MTIEDEVRAASEKFYSALNRMLNGDAGPLGDIWSHSATVTTMHPIGGREVGWHQVRGSWERVAQLATQGQARLSDQIHPGRRGCGLRTGCRAPADYTWWTAGNRRRSRHEHLSARNWSLEDYPSPH
jgi:hypothetical protein